MLWRKSWLDTRWRFLAGLALMSCSAVATVLVYPRVQALVAVVPTNGGGELGRRIEEAAALSRSFPGYVWSQLFRQNLSQLATLFAVLLGTAGLFTRAGGVVYTLSLPVSRRRVLLQHFQVVAAELFVLTLVAALLVPLIGPAIGAAFGIGAALAHAVCLFVASSVFLGLGLLLSTIFDDAWKPMLATLGVAMVLALLDPLLHAPSWSVFGVMSGETFFRTGRLPWAGLLASAGATLALVCAALVRLEHRDF